MPSLRYVYTSFCVCAALLAILISSALAQDITTWHGDNYRTGWQQYETTLTPTNVTYGSFGKVFSYTVSGNVFAQPLSLSQVTSQYCGHSIPMPCDMVFIATEDDMLYAFDPAHPIQLWSLNLAAAVTGGTYVDCSNGAPPPCASDGDVIYPHIGVTGTPVIDSQAKILYVVTLIDVPPTQNASIQYYIHAIDITTGQEKAGSPQKITATFPGLAPSTQCGTSGGGSTVIFDPATHYQRSGLLLLNGMVYVAFAPAGIGELSNGWIFGYTYNGSAFSSPTEFNTTPNGTGGGVWEASSGLATDGTYIYAATGNGTFDRNSGGVDYGDTLLRLNANLTVSDYFTSGDQYTRCGQDTDFGSGGVLIFQDQFFHDQSGNPLNLLVMADKESKIFFANRDNLGQFIGPPGTDHVVQEIVTPTPAPNSSQKYVSNPAFWKWGSSLGAIYYSSQVTQKIQHISPQPLNMYSLNSSVAPISGTPSASTGTLFCDHGAIPSISSSGTDSTTGILWAIEVTVDTNVPPQPDCTGSHGPSRATRL